MSAHKGIEVGQSGGQVARLQNGGIPQLKSRHKVTGLCWLLST